MGKEEKSSSIEQQMAEQIIFQKVNDWLGVELVENAKIFVGWDNWRNLCTYWKTQESSR